MTTPAVAIGWLPRERFQVAAESLQSLLDTTSAPLVIVDAGTPRRHWEDILAVLGDHPAEIISTGRPVLPAAAKNLVLERVDTEFVALVENDVLFPPGWLDGMLAAARQEGADVVAPAILDGRGDKEHFDKHLGEIVESQDHPGKLAVMPLSEPRNAPTGRRRVQFVEQHCLLYRRSVFDRIGPFDEELNTRDEVDLSLALHHAGCTIVLDPAVCVRYMPPSWRPDDDELPFYRHRWDLEQAARSREVIRDRWNLVETPGDLGFVRYRNLIARLPEVRRHLAELAVPAGSTALLENGDWLGTDLTDGLALRPFPDLDGRFGGFPASDAAAVAEFDRAIEDGVRTIVVGFPAFWWFDHLPELARRLAERCTVRRDDDLLRVLDVSLPAGAATPRS